MKALSISSDRLEEYKKILSAPEEELNSVKGILYASRKVFPTYSLVLSQLKKVTDGDIAEIILKHAVALQRLADQNGESAGNIFEALKKGLRKAGYVDFEDSRLTIFKEIVSSPSVVICQKAGDIYFDNERHIHDARVFTDVRPVFDESREDIYGYILVSRLRIIYSDTNENEKYFQVTLTRNDLKNVIRQCERALKKLDTCQENFENSDSLAIVYGEGFMNHD